MLLAESHSQYLNYLGQFTVFLILFLKLLVAAPESNFVDTRPPLACQRFVCNNQAVRKTKPLVHKTVNPYWVSGFSLFLTAKQKLEGENALLCLVCYGYPAEDKVTLYPQRKVYAFFPFDQERPCLCIVGTFLHRCFVLRNPLLNNVVWLTMELVCVFYGFIETIFTSSFVVW